MAEKTSEVSRREQPRSAFDTFADELERMFDDFGFGRGWLGRAWFSRAGRQGAAETWSPQIELSQRNNELVMHADLPGLKKDDVNVDITDEAITISGERKHEQESESGGVYRSERKYGSFYRTIPLPRGSISDQAKATFKDGVLEIRVPAPPEQVTRGRRLEIQDTKK
jgi:HSP20 family protein